jgi:hypothetical protein
MRIGVAMVLFVGALGTGASPIHADDADLVASVIANAIRAHGGADHLSKLTQYTRTATGKMFFFGQEVPFKDELTVHLPRRWHWSLDLGSAGQKKQITVVMDGDKGWQSTDGMVDELKGERLTELTEEGYVLWLSSFIPLKEDKEFQLSLLPEEKVQGQPAAVLRAAHKGHGEMRLFFDKQTGLLLKIARRAREAGAAVDKEYLYDSYKLTEGVALPTKYTEMINGKKFVEVSELSYKLLDRVSDNTFAKP